RTTICRLNSFTKFSLKNNPNQLCKRAKRPFTKETVSQVNSLRKKGHFLKLLTTIGTVVVAGEIWYVWGE
ncbi:hypothetical protein NE619_08370, partial [Anaerovorax odorimutans]